MASSMIKHVVIIVKQNHAFDTYFGRFPRADGDASLAPALDPPPSDAPHNHSAWLRRESAARRQQYSEDSIPAYFEYARQFTLCDRYFSDVAGPATPNHLMLIAADSLYIDNPRPYRQAPEERLIDIPSLPQRLSEARFEWRNYGGYAFRLIAALKDSPQNLTSAQFAGDAQAGRLPAVSWVYADFDNDEHPGFTTRDPGRGGVKKGMTWTVNQVDAIVRGGLWPEVVIFITWDNYGGWWDHVNPPLVERWSDGTQFRYGSRVPCLVMSPYAKSGFVSHAIHSHVSLLSYCERLFGLQPLNKRTAADDGMTECFD